MAANWNYGGQHRTRSHIIHTKLTVVAVDERSFKVQESLIDLAFGNYLHQIRQHEDILPLSSACKQVGYHCEFQNVYNSGLDYFFKIFLQGCRRWCELSRTNNCKVWMSTDNEEAFSSKGSAKNVHQGIKLHTFSIGSMWDRCTFVQHYKHTSPINPVTNRRRKIEDKTSILDFEHDSRFLSISFHSPTESRVVRSLVEYKLRVRYEDLQKFILIDDSETYLLTAFFMLKTPPKFQLIERSKKGVTTARVNHTRDCAANVIGNSSVLAFAVMDESHEKFQEVISRLRAFGFSIHWSHISLQLPSPPINNPDFNGDFRIAYALNCLMSQGFLITDRAEGLLSRLRALPHDEYPAAERALQELAIETELSFEGDRFIDLASQFEIKFQLLLASGDYDEEQYDNYMYVRRAIVTPTRCLLLPAELMAKNRILRRFGEEYCVRIVFRDETFYKLGSFETSQSDEIQRRVVQFLSSGIQIANRHYEFLACSNSQLRDHGCWLYAQDQDQIKAADIRYWMGTFTNIRCVATYISRMGQCFSTSEESVKVSVEDGQVEHEDDIMSVNVGPGGKRYCFSDGIGKVSSSLAARIAHEVNKKKVPSAFQIRYGGCKGMIAIDPTIRGDKLVIRPSMDKFESPLEEIEVMNNSRPGRLYLNRQAITLLSGLGIPDDIFQELQENMLYELGGMFFDDNRAAESLSLRASQHSAINYHQVAHAGISLTNEPYFRGLLLAVYRNWIGQLQRQARIEIPPEFARNMVGVLDETGILRYGQVFIQYSKNIETKKQGSKEVYTGQVVISKFPALHPGDFRKFMAVDVPELHHMVDCVVFPQRGRRPHPDEMAGSDLDGDEYFVSWMPELIFEGVNEEPMDFISPPKKIHNGPIEVPDMIEYIADYIKNDNIGLIANAHLAQADNQDDGIFSDVCKEIAEIHAEAVDFAKTGYSPDLTKEHRPHRYPDFMGKRDKSSYKSKRILGSLFRQCRQIDRIAVQQKESGLPNIPYDAGLEHPGWETHNDEAERSRDRYNHKLESILTQYGITSESEALSGNIRILGKRFTQRNEIYDAKNIIGVKVRQLRNATRRSFFEEFGEREEYSDECLAKASAWYITTYNHPERKYLSFPWVVSDVLCEVRKRSPAAAEISVPSIMRRLSTEAEIGAYSQRADTDRLRRIISSEMLDESLQVKRNQDLIIQYMQATPWIRPTAGILIEWRSKQALRKVIHKWELLILLLGYAIHNGLIPSVPRGVNTSLTSEAFRFNQSQPLAINDDVAMKLLVDFFSFCGSRKFHSREFRRIPHGCRAPNLSKSHLDRISSAADKAYHNLALCGTIDSILQDNKANTDDEIQEESKIIGNELFNSSDAWLPTLKEEFPTVEVSIRKLGGRNARYPNALVTIKGPLSQVCEVQDRIEEWESAPPPRVRNADEFLARLSLQHRVTHNY
ncbi:uncharacterized protein [Amphiura filiformis]|uniref:uncharacterized protein n=1 Tax=Amphiura filiformis TaxID=82378 RepID=UPI003B20EF01